MVWCIAPFLPADIQPQASSVLRPFGPAVVLLLVLEKAPDGGGRLLVVLRDGVGVDVHCELGRGVPEPVLHSLDVRAGSYEQGRLRVTELMEVEADVSRAVGAPEALAVGVLHDLLEVSQPVVREPGPAPPAEDVWLQEVTCEVRAHR